MSLRWNWPSWCAVLFLAVSSQKWTEAQEFQSPSPEKSSIQVFLTALDKHGSPATPTDSELKVFVDKQPAQIKALQPAKNAPLLFAVLVDASRSDLANAESIRKAALYLFQSLTSDTSRGYLVLFNISAAISKQPLQVSQVQSALDGVQFGGGTAVYDAIEQTCIQKLSRSGNPDTPRRAIMLISDGDDNQSHVTRHSAEEAAAKEGVAVFSLTTEPTVADTRGEYFLKEISHDTGGEVVRSKNLTDGVALLIAAIESQWALSFVPAQPSDKKVHSLDIKTSQKGVRISAPTRILFQ